ncbi:hypothetical protein [Streptomyces mexicanus]|uniref:hypothetical protein n=1 Tax=Streptomyces mexicanus TaxID=178566 RepID=UPI003662A85D
MSDRDRAIAHLAEALYLLSAVRNPGDEPTVPVTIGDQQIMLTPKTAEAIADAIDSMNAYMASETVHDNKIGMAARQAELTAWLEGQASETIPSGVWSAAAVAQNDPHLYAQVVEAFADVDPRTVTANVMNDRHASCASVIQALDDVFGDYPDPYADEDDA